MKREVQVYFGNGKGKTTAAVGHCIKEASCGNHVIIIQFLKGKSKDELGFLAKLEPEIKMFRFEKEDQFYLDLPEEKRQEEKKNILNGFNFAKKVIETGECDLLVLDEVLGLIDLEIITVEELTTLLKLRDNGYKLILTGNKLPDGLLPYVDMAAEIHQIKG
jgi:cob(I)alamin adenosyltransferase